MKFSTEFVLILVFLATLTDHYKRVPATCQRLGEKPSKVKPARFCWYYCFEPQLYRVFTGTEEFATPCQQRPFLAPGFCYGRSCMQNWYARSDNSKISKKAPATAIPPQAPKNASVARPTLPSNASSVLTTPVPTSPSPVKPRTP